jgi:hypothetical protein
MGQVNGPYMVALSRPPLVVYPICASEKESCLSPGDNHLTNDYFFLEIVFLI